MKQHPILFSGPMVRAILRGCKTQTRRFVKPQPRLVGDGVPYGGTELVGLEKCRYGVGDRLWVRETFSIEQSDLNGVKRTFVNFAADNSTIMKVEGLWDIQAPFDKPQKWKPSIYMPRWASRITLEVTRVRCERVQDISEADAMAEGIGRWEEPHPWENDKPNLVYYHHQEVNWRPTSSTTARFAFQRLWDSINGKDACKRWEANPWVWVIQFKRVK